MDNEISRKLDGLAIKDESLAEKAAKIIRDKIITGVLIPGERLAEHDFALALGISRACVREAFQILEYEGLIRKVANKYTEIVRLTLQDIEEIYRLRAAIEVSCLEMAQARNQLPLDQLAAIARVINSRYQSATASQDALTWIEEDFAFHELLVASSGNRRAIDAWHRLKNQAILALYDATLNYWNPKTIANHEELVETMRQSPLAVIAEQIKKHIMDGFFSMAAALGANQDDRRN